MVPRRGLRAGRGACPRAWRRSRRYRGTSAALGANLSSVALTTSITRGNDLLLYRTVELPLDDAERVAEVQRSVAVAAAYFEDKLGRAADRLHYAGAVPLSDFARVVGQEALNVVVLAPSPSTGGSQGRRLSRSRASPEPWRGWPDMRITINLATRPFIDLVPALRRLRIAHGRSCASGGGPGRGPLPACTIGRRPRGLGNTRSMARSPGFAGAAGVSDADAGSPTTRKCSTSPRR